VREASARLGQRNEVARALNENHLSICKYKSQDAASYRAVVSRFEATMEEIRNKSRAEAVAQSLQAVAQVNTNAPSPSLEDRLASLKNK